MLNKVHVNDHKLTQTRRTRHSESSVKWTDWDKFDNPKIIKLIPIIFLFLYLEC